jgi:hypothetical protein
VSAAVVRGCPDWRRLAAARDASPAQPAGWEEAVRHLDACPDCRRAAIEADPLLAFRRLPAPALAVDEVESMRLRVAALRGAARVGTLAGADAPAPVAPGGRLFDRVPRLRTLRHLRALPLRQLAAAVLVLAAVLAGGNRVRHSPTAIYEAAAVVSAGALLDAALASEPVLDELDQPFDHVVQWNGDDLSVVLVVDERLGV